MDSYIAGYKTKEEVRSQGCSKALAYTMDGLEIPEHLEALRREKERVEKIRHN